MGVGRRPSDIQIKLRHGSTDWRVLEPMPAGDDALSRVVENVEEFVLGFRYLFLRTVAGAMYSFLRDDVLLIQRRRGGRKDWTTVPNRCIGDRHRPLREDVRTG